MPIKLLIIGISGVTCGGKTTLACHLNECIPKSKLISQDDYFLDVDDPRHIWIPELNHINFDILSSLDMEKMYNDIQDFTRDKEIINMQHPPVISKKVQSIANLEDIKLRLYEKLKKSDLQILIIEGFSIFNYKPFRNLFHVKYYFTLPKQECYKRRSQRVYDPPDCPGYFELCVWPEHEKQLKEVRNEMVDVKYFDGTFNDALHDVLLDIESVIDKQ